MKRLRIGFLWLVSVLVLAACVGGDSAPPLAFSPITPAEFPVALGAGFPVAQVVDASPVAVAVGQPAPNFAFVWEDGRGGDLAALQGRPVIVNFWATWCGPCRAEMPELVAMSNQNSDLVVLEVNTQETLAAIQPFAEEFGMTMPVLVDEAGAVRKLYGVRTMPTTLFIDRQGIVSARWTGLLTGDQLGQFVTQIQAN
ncbi:MAG: redoxin domain-containing protein [Caldilineaceae bacterium]